MKYLNVHGKAVNIVQFLCTMDYVKLYARITSSFQQTTPFGRLIKRSPTDSRFSQPLYTEIHHILPRSQGGSDDPSNLVVVLPEEHLFLHWVRFKAHGCRADYDAVKFCLGGILKRKLSSQAINKTIRKSYAMIRSQSYFKRKANEYHTASTRKKISLAMKGRIPCYDPITNSVISVYATDPRYMSGEIKHHMHGKLQSAARRAKRKPSDGSNNQNYRNISHAKIIEYYKEFYNSRTSINVARGFKKEFVEFVRIKQGYKNMSWNWFTPRYGSKSSSFVQQMHQETGINIYDKDKKN